MRTLVIPDSHSEPEVSNERYDVLGEFIVAMMPDNIVQIGDFTSLDSITFHNHGRPKLQENRRLVYDINHGIDAYERMMAPLRGLWDAAKVKKRRRYSPNMYWLNGNHEDRVARFIETQPVLEGIVDGDDLLGVQSDGWKFIPYRDYCTIMGTTFTHVPMNPRTGKPLSGQYVCARAAQMSQDTIVFGHTHTRNVMAFTRLDSASETGGHRVEGLTVGCWLDHWPDYMKHNTATCDWWEGITILHHYAHGRVDPEYYSKERIYREWG